MEEISGPKTGRWVFVGAAGGPAGLEGWARPLGCHSGRRDGKTGNSTVCVCMHVCSFNVLYVFMSVFMDQKCMYFPVHACKFMYVCMDVMCVKVCRYA